MLLRLDADFVEDAVELLRHVIIILVSFLDAIFVRVRSAIRQDRDARVWRAAVETIRLAR